MDMQFSNLARSKWPKRGILINCLGKNETQLSEHLWWDFLTGENFFGEIPIHILSPYSQVVFKFWLFLDWKLKANSLSIFKGFFFTESDENIFGDPKTNFSPYRHGLVKFGPLQAAKKGYYTRFSGQNLKTNFLSIFDGIFVNLLFWGDPKTNLTPNGHAVLKSWLSLATKKVGFFVAVFGIKNWN